LLATYEDGSGCTVGARRETGWALRRSLPGGGSCARAPPSTGRPISPAPGFVIRSASHKSAEPQSQNQPLNLMVRSTSDKEGPPNCPMVLPISTPAMATLARHRWRIARCCQSCAPSRYTTGRYAMPRVGCLTKRHSSMDRTMRTPRGLKNTRKSIYRQSGSRTCRTSCPQ
jgi:hypothetical protein